MNRNNETKSPDFKRDTNSKRLIQTESNKSNGIFFYRRHLSFHVKCDTHTKCDAKKSFKSYRYLTWHLPLQLIHFNYTSSVLVPFPKHYFSIFIKLMRFHRIMCPSISFYGAVANVSSFSLSSYTLQKYNIFQHECYHFLYPLQNKVYIDIEGVLYDYCYYYYTGSCSTQSTQ